LRPDHFALRLALTALILLLAASSSHAQTTPSPQPSGPTLPDWLDDFPAVSEVAIATFEELKIDAAQSNRPDSASDPDTIAMYLVGTFMTMRGILFLKYNEEQQPMAKDREAKLKAIYAAYAEAELAIGQGWNVRRGYITRGPDGRGCAVGDVACYRRWFANDILNIAGRASYRKRLLARVLPCGDRAKELDELRQRNAIGMPHLPSPAVTGQVEREVAAIAPAGCGPYGGDANGNGLCDDWEKAFANSQPTSTKPPAAPLRMTQLRNDSSVIGRGLKVSIERANGVAGLGGCFRVVRADRASLVGAKELWHGFAKIESGADATQSLTALVAPKTEFPVDPALPFLLVEFTSGPSYGAVHCEQPSKASPWLARHLTPKPNGLHGPYKDIDLAMTTDPAGRIALDITAQSNYEAGYMVVRNTKPFKGGDSYYVTAPLQSTQGLLSRILKPQFLPEDYYLSFQAAFDKSCEDSALYKVAALVHTHPSSEKVRNFSMDDINQVLKLHPGWAQFKEDDPSYALELDLEQNIMIDGLDRCIRSFDPRLGGKPFPTSETYLDPTWSQDYLDFVKQRVRQVGASCIPR
jgi:hypothetical protein